MTVKTISHAKRIHSLAMDKIHNEVLKVPDMNIELPVKKINILTTKNGNFRLQVEFERFHGWYMKVDLDKVLLINKIQIN